MCINVGYDTSTVGGKGALYFLYKEKRVYTGFTDPYGGYHRCIEYD
jgi:hypothetical protein